MGALAPARDGDQPVTNWTVTTPGVVENMPPEAYHADPVPGGSLSSSGARRLLPPSCPALFRYEQDNGQPPKQAWDLGRVAHHLVLGRGEEYLIVQASDWRTKAAKQERDDARANGLTPILAGDYSIAEAMADALERHPIAPWLFAAGKPEQSLFWVDPTSGVWLRARLDWLPDARGGRIYLGEYKTCHNADPTELARQFANFGYHQQAAWYLDGVMRLGLADDPRFLFVAQEKTPPYLVTVAEVDRTALRIGAYENRRAIDLYARCKAENHWPPYVEDVAQIALPAYVENRYTAEEIA